ncbi:MAG TPA: CHAT domain-containing tetratricopeptide repeat protein [Steroidobacteraceae bacterium]|nr:CHAT domain-containing tetratricopeptide repeat protein [Steroidobacteraceae bacterium]
MRDRVATSVSTTSRALRLAIGHCCASVLAASLVGCGNAPDELATESSTELPLAGDGAPEITRELAAGTWLIEVRERGIDARIAVDAPGTHDERSESTSRHGVIHDVVSLRSPGALRIVVRSDDNPATSGKVVVRIASFRASGDAEPSDLQQGFRAWAKADAESSLATPESWARAADKLNEAILHFEAAGDEHARAEAAYALANLQHDKRDDWSAAIRAAEIAAESFDASGDQDGLNNAAIIRATAEIDLATKLDAGTQRAEQKSLYEAADRRLAEAQDYFVGQDNRARAARAANMRGVRAFNLGQESDAATHFARALELLRGGEDRAEQTTALMNLAWVHRLQGQVRQAADEYQSLMPLLDAQRQSYLYATMLNNYGFCLIALGDFDRALELHTQALGLFARLGQKSERATQLTALGTLYFRVGDGQRALETLRSAIVEFEKLGDNSQLVSTLRLAGNAASSVGQHDIALEYLRRSASIDSNPLAVSRTRVLIAGELRQVGDLAGAESELAESLRSGNRMVQADALAERARIRMSQRRPPDALGDLRAADSAYRELGLEFSRIDVNATLAQLLLSAHDVAGASQAADEAVAIVRRLRVNSANPEWRARFLSAKYAPFEARIAVDLVMPAAAGGSPAWAAFRTADEVRAGSLADQLASTGSNRPAEDADMAKLRDKLNILQLRLEARVQNPQADPEVTTDLRRDVAEARARLDEHRARRDPVRERTLRLPPSLYEVQKKLPADTLVLAYFVGDTASHAWLLSRSQLRHVPLPGRSRLQQSIDATLDHPADSATVRLAHQRLGKMLLDDLLDHTGERKLLIIPDGPLNAVAFAALPMPTAPNEQLVDRFLIGYAPSLALAFAQPEQTGSSAARVAVISDPVYAPDDQRLSSLAAGGNFRGSRPVSPNKFTRLPYSGLEARAVRDAFGRKDTISLEGFDATRKRVLELATQDLSVLHFATHAVAREDAPERSALFLSEYAADGAFDGESQLSTSDIMSSGLHAQVVVLSGCATGDGSTLRGEGVLGLTYGFLANGSGAVVASLWPVEDASTARLMNEFYKSYRVTGNAAEALRAAQLRMRAGRKGEAVWSSFVVRANGFP